MRRILLALLIIFSFTGVTNTEKDPDTGNYWFCRQVGLVENEKTFIITYIFRDELINHYQERQVEFQKHLLKITKNRFEPSFDAKCKEYEDRKDAEKHRDEELKTAEKYKLHTLQIPWRFTPDVEKRSK
jgi:dolichyl-phosphate-mannose--protein O-mannosyl transferase